MQNAGSSSLFDDLDAALQSGSSEKRVAMLRQMTDLFLSEADRLASEGAFGEGSMAPKVAAAADYVRRTQGRAIITELSKGRAAVEGKGGTEIIP